MCDSCGRHGDGGHDHRHGDGGHDHPHGEDTHVHSHSHTHLHGHSHDESTVVETDGTIRLAVAGKGGVGKSTLSAAIAQHIGAHHELTAIDADPDMNLARTLGVEAPPPITDERELIEDRAGGDGLVALTPDVEDVLDSHSVPFGQGGRLLTIGAPAAGNTGCLCSENSFVRSLVSNALDGQYVLMDMEAGVEHLGRGTAEAVDALLVVVEPSRTSIETAERIQSLATDLGIDEVRAVINKSRGNAEEISAALDVPVIATLPYDDEIATAGLDGESPVAASEQLRAAAADIVGAFDPTDE